ncbi:MAG: ABC transporter ATP-binding protein [Candidatus Paralactobacillus gallistercoris]|uniref:ABC transporter ATP-binding protein n=1 Tax=Candidatus Paralactobacillus gallistercoris TaxID=2838724 RepID=A0A948TI61_9LACO|nr:ABC transporter ATP-binding protein [Candidatus Paralactobacillus gallistercoris]
MPLLQLQHVKRIFADGKNNATLALKDISFTLNQGEFVAIMGESGAGKSTLLNIIATLDQPTNGKVILNNQDLTNFSEKKAAQFRREHLGFVFQNFNLLDTFNNRDNIFLPLVLTKHTYQDMQQRLTSLAQELAITDLLNRYPYEISGGQQQRIAIARALITHPDLLLADEPTGALDSHNSEKILHLFEKVNQQGQTILMVTHSPLAACYAQHILFIKDGIIYHELFRGNQNKNDYIQQITDNITALSKEEII